MIEIALENTYIQSLIIGLILVVVYFKLSRRAKLNEPPLAYYQFPFIGHTWSFLTNCQKLISESREKYGETFSLYVYGQIITVVGKESTYEVLTKHQEFGFKEQLPTNHILNHDISKNHRLIRDFITGKLKYLLSRLQKNIIKAIDIYIGDCAEPRVIHEPSKIISDIIAIPIASIIVGEDCCNHEDLLETFKSVTSSISKFFLVPPILSFKYPWLYQKFVTIPLRFGWSPISKYRKIVISRIKSVVEKRLNDKKRLGDAWVAPLDALQCYLDDPEITPNLDPNNVNYDYIADAIADFIFAALGTTNFSATRTFFDLVKRKQQYWQELYQEAREINKQCNGYELTSDDISKMVKLDSFIKESLRIAKAIIRLPHKCISKPYYTFTNGYQIPYGRVVYLNVVDTHHDEELQGQNPTEFYAYRHDSPATKVERKYLVFGLGKHACPGRSLAVNEMKMLLHNLILKYDIKSETINPIRGSMVFENRKEEFVN
ncbi:cytochrome P450 [Gigaspora rosea]|uniref:Cytochrome P450 n=1 Tax=Gigaspora rosea TaxID=44941 RepID=A0A397U8H8_9GLOM|nr:cytochrome P450 [Gigaspora rosea]